MKRWVAFIAVIVWSGIVYSATWQERFAEEVALAKKEDDRSASIERLKAYEAEGGADQSIYTLALLDALRWRKEAKAYKAKVLANAEIYAKLPAAPFAALENRANTRLYPGASALTYLLIVCAWEPEELQRLASVAKAACDGLAYGLAKTLQLGQIRDEAAFAQSADALLADPLLDEEVRAMVLSSKAERAKTKAEEAPLLMEALKFAKLHSFRAELQRRLNVLRQTCVTLEQMPDLVAPGKTTFTLRYQNTDMVRITYEGAVKHSEMVRLPAPKALYEVAEIEVTTPELPVGEVKMTVVPETTFDEEPLTLEHTFTVNTLAVAQLWNAPLTLIVWDTRTGEPISGATVSLSGETATADAAGIVRLKKTFTESYVKEPITVQVGSGTLKATVQGSRERPLRADYTLLTDRSVYRPGETVHFQLIGKRFEPTRSYPAQGEVTLILKGHSYNREKVELNVPLLFNENGSAAGSIVLPENFTGALSAYVGNASFATIHVLEYRANSLVLSVAATKPRYKVGEAVTFSGTAFDQSGTPLAGTAVQWELSEGSKGEVQVAEDGTFTCEVVPKEDGLCYLNATFTATAHNGEQTESFASCHISKFVDLQLEGADWMMEGDSCRVTVKSEAEVSGTVAFMKGEAVKAELPFTTNTPLELSLLAGDYDVFYSVDGVKIEDDPIQVLPQDNDLSALDEAGAILRLKGKRGLYQLGYRENEPVEGFAAVHKTPAQLMIFTRTGLYKALPLTTPYFSLPIEEGMKGGFALMVVGMRGGALLSETAGIEVVSLKPLTLTMERFEAQASPASKQTWTLTVDDPTAEVVLTCFDKALESVYSYSWEDVFLPRPWLSGYWGLPYLPFKMLDVWEGERLPQDFTADYRPYYGGVRTRRVSAKQSMNADRDGLAVPAPVEMAEEAPVAQVGVSGAALGHSAAPLRTNFAPTALWSPQCKVEEGKVTFTFTLPDTLTTWKVMAFAYTPDGRQGALETECVASKPVMLKPYLPRFMRVGDKVTVQVAVTNTTEHPIATWVELNGAARKALTLPAKGTENAAWTVEAKAGEKTLRCAFTSPEDSVEMTIPVYPKEEQMEVVTPITLRDTQPFTVEVEGEIRWEWVAHPMEAVREALHEVLKSTCRSSDSRFARILAMCLLEKMGEPRPAGFDKAFAELKAMQRADGTFPWFEGGESSEYSTATIAMGLARLRRLGIDLPLEVKPKSVAVQAYNTAKIDPTSAFAEEMTVLASTSPWRIERAMLGVSAWENGITSLAQSVLKEVLEGMNESLIWGNWWKKSACFWCFYETPMEYHTFCMEMLQAANQQEALRGAALWLLQNRRFNQWGSPYLTGAAAYALLKSGVSLEANPEIKVEREGCTYTFTRPTAGITFGRLISTRPVMSEPSPLLTFATDWEAGRCTLTLDVKQDLSHVVIEVPRPATMEPKSSAPSWQWMGRSGVYLVPHDTGTTCYVTHLPRGKSTFTLEHFVTHQGNVTTPPAAFSLFYCPDVKLYAFPK